MQGAIESVGPREVLRLAVAQGPARLLVASDGDEVVLWCAPDGIVEVPGEGGHAVDRAAEVLAMASGTFTLERCDELPAGAVVALTEVLAAADRLVAVGADARRLPSTGARVRPVARLGGPSVITGDQWRILARVGAGRTVHELAGLLELDDASSRRVVADLVDAGLLEVAPPVVPLTAPPAGPALAPPAPVAAAGTLPPPPPAAPTGSPLAAPAGPHPGWADAPGLDPSGAAGPLDAPPVWTTDTGTGTGPAWTDPGSVGTGTTGAEIVGTGSDDVEIGPEEAWIEPEPVHVGDDWDWDPEPSEVASSWDDHGAQVAAHADWDPEPLASPAEVADTLAAVAGAAALDRDGDGVTDRGVDRGVDTLAAAAADGEPPTPSDPGADDELVNRALLFKFLSSVRE